MSKAVWLLVAGVGLLVCAEYVPAMKGSKPGASYEQFVEDRTACVQQTQAESRPFYLGGNRYGGKKNVLEAGIFLPCMHEHGYASDPNGYAAPPGDELPLSP